MRKIIIFISLFNLSACGNNDNFLSSEPTVSVENFSCVSIKNSSELISPLIFCKDSKNRLVLDFDTVLSNTCTDLTCSDSFALTNPNLELILPLCDDPSSFSDLPAWAINSCRDPLLFSNSFDSNFSQGFGNYVSLLLEPLRYINNGNNKLKVQFFVNRTDSNKVLKPQQDSDGLVVITNEIEIVYDVSSPFINRDYFVFDSAVNYTFFNK